MRWGENAVVDAIWEGAFWMWWVNGSFEHNLRDAASNMNACYSQRAKNLQYLFGFRAGFVAASNDVVLACSKKERFWELEKETLSYMNFTPTQILRFT